jgi:hypothetical protein
MLQSIGKRVLCGQGVQHCHADGLKAEIQQTGDKMTP